MIQQVMPSYHRVRGHILSAQMRQQQQHQRNRGQGQGQSQGQYKTSSSFHPDSNIITTRSDKKNPVKSFHRSSSVDFSFHLSLSSFDLALITDEELLARTHLEQISMDITPSRLEVEENKSYLCT